MQVIEFLSFAADIERAPFFEPYIVYEILLQYNKNYMSNIF